MDSKILGERLRQIRLMLGLTQKELAVATYLAQPVISRLENGEEVYASALLAVLDFYREKVNFDRLFDPDLDTSDKSQLYCSSQELRQRLDRQLAVIAHDLEESLGQITGLRDQI